MTMKTSILVLLTFLSLSSCTLRSDKQANDNKKTASSQDKKAYNEENSCSAMNEDSIYSFLNNRGQSVIELGESPWGIFFIDRPYVIDSSICEKILDANWSQKDSALAHGFYNCCKKLDIQEQLKFRWKQDKLHKYILVADTKHKIKPDIVSQLALTNDKEKDAAHWIKEWNKSKVDDRLINYSSIPVFSSDQNYVLIVRGQDVRSEGGWDKIYIYKRTIQGWVVYQHIIISSI